LTQYDSIKIEIYFEMIQHNTTLQQLLCALFSVWPTLIIQ